MRRRKFLVGMGALTAGATAAVGTGAFTSASIPDRTIDVSIDADDESQIALVSGDDPDISLSDGELHLDLSGAEGEGVNINSRYSWGDSDNPESSYAFKIVNNDDSGESYGVSLFYDLDDRSWVDPGSPVQSQLFVEVYDGDGYFDRPADSGNSEPFPHSHNGTMTQGDNALNMDSFNPENRYLNSGESWYVVIHVDTTGPNASVDDNLAGSLNLELTEY